MKYWIVMALLVVAGCTSENEASRVLRGAGYKDVQFTGYSFFACGKDDGWSTGFRAVGPTGQQVSGTVCSGLLKGATIRID